MLWKNLEGGGGGGEVQCQVSHIVYFGHNVPKEQSAVQQGKELLHCVQCRQVSVLGNAMEASGGRVGWRGEEVKERIVFNVESVT